MEQTIPKNLDNLWTSEIVDKYEYFIFDCDGVIWNGPDVIKEAVEFIKKLYELKKSIFYLSNIDNRQMI